MQQIGCSGLAARKGESFFMKCFSTSEVELSSLHDLRAVANLQRSNFILALNRP